MARYNGRLHCIVGVLPTCYKRKAAIYFYPPGGTGPHGGWRAREMNYLTLLVVPPPSREIQIHHRLNIPRNAYVKPTQMIPQRMSSVYRHRLQLLRTFYSSRPRKKDKCRACPFVIEKALHGIAGVPKTKKSSVLVTC